MKKRNAKILIISTFLLSISIISFLSIFSFWDNIYLATEDNQYFGGIKSSNNEKIICVGQKEAKQEFSMVFDLTKKPETWKNCFIQLYVIDFNNTNIPLSSGHQYGIEIWLSNSSFEGDNFPNLYGDEYWTYRQFDQEEGLRYKKGFQRWNITEFIEGRRYISLSAHTILWTVEHYISFYSLESDVDVKYKPQLIWS